MKVPCRQIAESIEKLLQKETDALKNRGIQPKLVTFLLDPTPEQQSFVSIKERVGKRIGIDFELVSLQKLPKQHELNQLISQYAEDSKTTGIIIQLPLPHEIDKQELYNKIPPEKEIEGHITNSHFQFPLSLAVLTGIKYIFSEKTDEAGIVDFKHDATFFTKVLQNKKVVIAGRGPTGGEPISKTFNELHIKHTLVHSQTKNPDNIFKEADIIVTATGKQIIHAGNIKKDVILLNVGLRKENNKLKGDYYEEEIAEIASYYTETPGGLGPLDVLYLYKNVIDAAK